LLRRGRAAGAFSPMPLAGPPRPAMSEEPGSPPKAAGRDRRGSAESLVHRTAWRSLGEEANSEDLRRSARGEKESLRGAGGKSRARRPDDGRGHPLRKNRNAGGRRQIGAARSGAGQNAAEAVPMILLLAARRGGVGFGRRAGDVAEGIERSRLRGCDKETLQQKRIERDHADRDAPRHRALTKSAHCLNLTCSAAIATNQGVSEARPAFRGGGVLTRVPRSV